MIIAGGEIAIRYHRLDRPLDQVFADAFLRMPAAVNGALESLPRHPAHRRRKSQTIIQRTRKSERGKDDDDAVHEPRAGRGHGGD